MFNIKELARCVEMPPFKKSFQICLLLKMFALMKVTYFIRYVQSILKKEEKTNPAK